MNSVELEVRDKGLAESKELEDFVRSACISIEKGVSEGLELKFPIEFEVAVLVKREKDGLFKLLIVNDSGNYAEQKVSRIKFKIGKQEAHSNRIHFFRE